MPFGMTSAGFVPKTQTDIVNSVKSKLRGAIGASLALDPNTAWDKVIGVFAGELAEPWEGGEDIYSSNTPDGAAGVALVDYSGGTGTVPLPPQQSSVIETLVGTSTTAVTHGRVISVASRNDSRFLTRDDVTIAAVTAWATSQAKALNARVKNGGNVYQATQAGTTASSGGGPAGTGAAIIDGTVVWKYLGAGDGAIDVVCLSEKFDAVSAPAGTLTRIDSPVNGLNAAVNLLDAELGRPEEVDPVLRVRRENELRAAGAAAPDAVRAAVLDLTWVKSCSVFPNNSDVTDSDGVPPHSMEIVVQLSLSAPLDAEQLIREAIFAAVSGGIRPFGSVHGTVTDATGKVQEVDFSYLTSIPAWVRLDFDVTKDFPPDGIAQIEAALLGYEADTLVGGYDLTAFGLGSRAQRDVAGIFDLTLAAVGASGPPALLRMPVATREIAELDTSRMTINVHLVVP